MVSLELDDDISAFLASISPALEREAAIHSFFLSLVARVRDSGKSAPVMARGIGAGGGFRIAGVQTSHGYPLVISKGSESEARAFAEALCARQIALPGVNGPVPGADAFAEGWCARTGCRLELGVNLRLFQLDAVIAPVRPSGRFRDADLRDLELLLEWTREFAREAMPNDPVADEAERRDRVGEGIVKGHYALWEDGEPVSFVGSTRESSAGRWIAPVYTPPRFRGKGYASAVVAELSERIIRSGRKCLLFTDQANPTSNSIYQKIGYRPLGDSRHIRFVS
ncbi:MAG: GNAT family N-acetyltransferase [Oligoflexia bacterium]|nr:GNAT family N-acetyltransferase [Oligoflexia bacterium]